MARSAPEVEVVEKCLEEECEEEMKKKKRMGIQREEDDVVKSGEVGVCEDGHLSISVRPPNEPWPGLERVE
ncbi:hypothetical protein [Halosimplex pelagicum]|uniref:Uncharacterized protein n=1 Tax=Halosimplex pelagicum TaxID=869886 RepID=A0A7D5TCM8_9EURY|nr:hypothetical protein [Halosimplex pelagicum]QLH82195.1 hypothetical protein HZS54_11515 [Halosimplex pelagicum]